MIQKISLFSRAAVFWLCVSLPIIGVFMGRISEVILCIMVGFIALEAYVQGRFKTEILRLFGLIKTPLGLAFLSFFIWALVSCLWVFRIDLAFQPTLNALGFTAASFVLFDYFSKQPFAHLHHRLWQSLIFGCFIYGLIIVLWRFNMPLVHVFYSNLSVFNRPATGFWLLALPLFFHFGRTKESVLLLFAMMVVTFSTISTSSVLAAGIALCIYLLSLTKPRAVFHATMAICGLFIAFVPFIAHWPQKYSEMLPFHKIFGSSSTHRMAIWDNFATLSQIKPFVGWGTNSSRMMLDNPLVKTIPLNNPELNIGMHPHNFSLQVWVELGAVGVFFVLFTWVFMWFRLQKLEETKLRFVSMFIAACFAVSCVNYSLWQGWWIAYVGIGVALFANNKKKMVGEVGLEPTKT